VKTGVKSKSTKKEEAAQEEEKKADIIDADAILNNCVDSMTLENIKRDAALEKLLQEDINVTYENRRGQMHANTRDILVSGVTVNFHGKPLVEDTDIQINYGNRYGFIGPNGSGKSTIMKVRLLLDSFQESFIMLIQFSSLKCLFLFIFRPLLREQSLFLTR
jgi:ATP-binding cassette subfamily F protein 2